MLIKHKEREFSHNFNTSDLMHINFFAIFAMLGFAETPIPRILKRKAYGLLVKLHINHLTFTTMAVSRIKEEVYQDLAAYQASSSDQTELVSMLGGEVWYE